MKNHHFLLLLLIATFLLVSQQKSFAQAELQAWGKMSGIRIDGQLFKFETSVQVIKNDWKNISYTGKEKQRRPIYKREGTTQVVTTRIDSLFITTTVDELSSNSAKQHVKIVSKADSSLTGVFFGITVESKKFENGRIQLIEPSDLSLDKTIPSAEN